MCRKGRVGRAGECVRAGCCVGGHSGFSWRAEGDGLLFGGVAGGSVGDPPLAAPSALGHLQVLGCHVGGVGSTDRLRTSTVHGGPGLLASNLLGRSSCKCWPAASKMPAKCQMPASLARHPWDSSIQAKWQGNVERWRLCCK